MRNDNDDDLFNRPHQPPLMPSRRLHCVLCGLGFDSTGTVALCEPCVKRDPLKIIQEVVTAAERAYQQAHDAYAQLDTDDALSARLGAFEAALRTTPNDPKVVKMQALINAPGDNPLVALIRAKRTAERIKVWYENELRWADTVKREATKL